MQDFPFSFVSYVCTSMHGELHDCYQVKGACSIGNVHNLVFM